MLWQVLTPLINAGVYYVIFGVVLNTRGDVDNFIAYLCTGVFLFGFTQSVIQAGIQAITANLGLIRALHFPRASLPIAIALVELRNMVASMSVLIAIVLITGEPITVEWLLRRADPAAPGDLQRRAGAERRPAGRQGHRHQAADPVHHADLDVRLGGALPGAPASPSTWTAGSWPSSRRTRC